MFFKYVPPTNLGLLSCHKCTSFWPLQVSLATCCRSLLPKCATLIFPQCCWSYDASLLLGPVYLHSCVAAAVKLSIVNQPKWAWWPASFSGNCITWTLVFILDKYGKVDWIAKSCDCVNDNVDLQISQCTISWVLFGFAYMYDAFIITI